VISRSEATSSAGSEEVGCAFCVAGGDKLGSATVASEIKDTPGFGLGAEGSLAAHGSRVAAYRGQQVCGQQGARFEDSRFAHSSIAGKRFACSRLEELISAVSTASAAAVTSWAGCLGLLGAPQPINLGYKNGG